MIFNSIQHFLHVRLETVIQQVSFYLDVVINTIFINTLNYRNIYTSVFDNITIKQQ